MLPELDIRILVFATSFVLLSSGLTLGFGCGDEPAARIEFRDASEGCNPTPDRLTHPVAEGARLDVVVLADGLQTELDAAWVDDSAVLALEPGAESVGNPVVVRGLEPGTTRLHVTTAAGDVGELALEVATPASATIAADPLTVWNLDTTLTEVSPGATNPLEAGGYALLPDGYLVLRVELRDASGRTLIGHGAAGWSATPELVTFEEADPMRDDVRVVPGDTRGDVLIETVGGGTFELALVEEQDADELTVYYPETGVVGGELTLAVGETRTVVLVAFDEAGRLLVGNGEAGFEAAIPEAEPGVARVVAPPWSDEGGGEVDLEAAVLAFLEIARVAYVEGLAPGETVLTLGAAGLSTEVTVVVTE